MDRKSFLVLLFLGLSCTISIAEGESTTTAEPTKRVADPITTTPADQTTSSASTTTSTIAQETTSSASTTTSTIAQETTSTATSTTVQQTTSTVDTATSTTVQQTTSTAETATSPTVQQTASTVDTTTSPTVKQTASTVDTATSTTEQQTASTVDTATSTTIKQTASTADTAASTTEQQTASTVDTETSTTKLASSTSSPSSSSTTTEATATESTTKLESGTESTPETPASTTETTTVEITTPDPNDANAALQIENLVKDQFNTTVQEDFRTAIAIASNTYCNGEGAAICNPRAPVDTTTMVAEATTITPTTNSAIVSSTSEAETDTPTPTTQPTIESTTSAAGNEAFMSWQIESFSDTGFINVTKDNVTIDEYHNTVGTNGGQALMVHFTVLTPSNSTLLNRDEMDGLLSATKEVIEGAFMGGAFKLTLVPKTTPTPPTTSTTTEGTTTTAAPEELPGWAIALIVIGSLIGVAIIAAVIYFLCIRKKREESAPVVGSRHWAEDNTYQSVPRQYATSSQGYDNGAYNNDVEEMKQNRTSQMIEKPAASSENDVFTAL